MASNMDGAADKLLRTQGDGMENTNNQPDIKAKPAKESLMDKFIYRQSENNVCYIRPILPEGKVVNLVPKYVPRPKKSVSYLTKPKEPKFVPYEPYKGSVEPIIRRKKGVKKLQKLSKNNVDIQDLVTQMSELAAVEMQKSKTEAFEGEDVLIPRKKWEKERLDFETDIKNLQETNTHLENQLKFQAQVNRELKTLLVAAVGEDLESRVQHLTEDKLSLARELLKSANHLTSHQEHTEWLSGQCEVWRSKFLASSLMVEELANWKSTLTNKLAELKDIVRRLLEERSRVRDNSLKTLGSLSSVLERVHPSKETDSFVRSTNILELSAANQKLSGLIEMHLLKELPEPRKHRVVDSAIRSANTPAESAAMFALAAPLALQQRPDVLCEAVVGAASAVGRGQLFLQHPSKQATCCAHCQGDVKDV